MLRLIVEYDHDQPRAVRACPRPTDSTPLRGDSSLRRWSSTDSLVDGVLDL